MPNHIRYLVFAMIDFLLAAYVCYRLVLPVVLGQGNWSGFTIIVILMVLALIAMGVRFALRAKKEWGKE